jgi:tetratricopeptide (TPR) repeat protein
VRARVGHVGGPGAAQVPLSAPASQTGEPDRARRALDDLPRPLAHFGQWAGSVEEQAAVRRRCEAARSRMERDDYAGAVAELTPALELTGGEDFEVLYLLARAKQALGQRAEARVLAEYASTLRPADPEVQYLLGRLFREQSNWAAAAEHFRSATGNGPSTGDDRVAATVIAAWFELGDCLERLGYLWAAAQCFAEFDYALWEHHPEVRTADRIRTILAEYPRGLIDRRLELLKKLGEWARRVEVARWALRTRPEDAYLARLVAQSLLDAGQSGEAFEFCRTRVEASAGEATATTLASDPGALLSLAVTAADAAGRLEAWVAQVTQDVREGRRLALAQNLARRLMAGGRPAHAVPLWRALAAVRPDSADTVWDLAQAQRDAGDLRGALETLMQFVRQNETVGEFPAGRLTVWMRSFEATEEFLGLVTDFTARPDADFATHLVLGTLAAAASQYELAEHLFQAAAEANPRSPLPHVAWARMLLGAFRWEEAEGHARVALEREPQSASAHLVLAEALAGLDRYQEAEQAYKAVLERRPDDVACLLALARHYRRMENWLAAQRYAQQAWSIDHSCSEALEDLVEAYLATGKVGIARSCVQEAENADIAPDTLRRVRMAVRYAGQMMGPEHLAELRRQHAEFPEDVVVGLRLAAGLFLNDQPEEALAVLRSVPARGSEEEQALFLAARAHLDLLEAGPAIENLLELTRRYPRRLSYLSLLSDAYLADFRLGEAREVLRRILSLDLSPEDRERVRLRLVSTYTAFQDYDGGLAVLEDWLGSEPDSDLLVRAKLQALLDSGRGAEAVAVAQSRLAPVTERFRTLLEGYKRAAEQLRDRPGASDLEAELKGAERELEGCLKELYARREEFVEACRRTQQWDLAEQEIRSWIELQGPESRLQEWLIDVLLGAKKVDAALEAVTSYPARGPADLVNVFVWRARANAASGRLKEAVRELTVLLDEELIRSNETFRGQVRREIVALLIEGADYATAIDYCDRWLSEAGGDHATELEALLLKRAALQRAEREEDLIAVTQRLLEFDPQDPGLLNDLGYTWIERGENVDRALRMIRQAVAAQPLNAAFLDSLGWAYYMHSDFATARVHLSRATLLASGQDPVIYDHLGDTAYRLGDREEARRAWDKAQALLKEASAAERAASRPGLLVAVRSKLLALDQGAAPAVARTPAEREAREEP